MNKHLSFSSLQELYGQKSDSINRFVALQNKHHNMPRNYGDGAFLTAVELHTLRNIEDSPGITVTEMAERETRTKGAVSQIVKKLENRGYLHRKKCPIDGKRVLLYVNDEGRRISLLYKQFSANHLKTTLDELMKKCSAKDIDAFFDVIAAYTEILDDDLKNTVL